MTARKFLIERFEIEPEYTDQLDMEVANSLYDDISTGNIDELLALMEDYAKQRERIPIRFQQILREEFLINTQNYPKEYHELFHKKFNRAEARFKEITG